MKIMLVGRPLCLLFVVSSALGCAAEEEPRPAEPDAPEPIVKEVYDRCSDFAVRLCAGAADCCESTLGTFLPDDCVASFVAEFCGPASRVVGEGLATYHPELEEDCLEAWARAHATCVADWEEIVAIRRDVWAACKMVRGTTEAGGGCSTAATCAQPGGAAAVRCLLDPRTRSPTCQILEILGEGAECPYPLGDVSVCDVGLYCTTTQRDMPGTCAPVVAEGEACDPDVALNPECGLGSYCGLDDGLCHRATNFGGPGCVQHTECVSFTCRTPGANGTCTEAPSTALDLCERGAPA